VSHAQISIKVNAKVDRGVAPLVEALSEFPDVVTLSSCEGSDGQQAFVAFVVGNSDLKETGEFVANLSQSLGKFPGLCDETALSLLVRRRRQSECLPSCSPPSA
jgi:hypothetical protein